MYKDVIHYQLADGIDHAHLLKVAGDVIESWMKKQPGFIRWEIHKDLGDTESYTDIVFWQSEKDAQNSEKEMMNNPNAGEWFACYKEDSIRSQKLAQIGSFK